MRSRAESKDTGTAAATRPSAVRILVAAVVAQVGFSFLEQGIPSLTVFVKNDLGLSAAEAGAIVSIVGVGRLSGFYLAGRAVDLHGERRVLYGGAVAAGMLAALAVAFPFVPMLTVLFVAGAFLATATPAGGKLVYTAFAPDRRGIAMGIRQAAVPLGGLAAAAALPLVAHDLGWRPSFVVAGAVPCVGALIAFSVAGLGPRVRATGRGARPSTRGILRRDVRLWTVWATAMVGSQYVVLTFFAVDVRDRAHEPERTAALLLLVVQAGGVVGRVAWGWLADRLPRARLRALPVAMSLLSVATTGALALLPVDGLVLFAALGFLLGLSINSWQGIWMTRLTEMVGVASAGTATGVVLTIMALGWIVFTPAFGAIADASSSYAVMWGVLAVVLAGTGAAVLGIRGEGPAAAKGDPV
jgi:predicted MFS family arabinose efflux permease